MVGCERIARAGPLKRCVAHGGGNRCAVAGCSKSARTTATQAGGNKALMLCAKHQQGGGLQSGEDQGEEDEDVDEELEERVMAMPSDASLQLLMMSV